MAKEEYILRLQNAVKQLHKCDAAWAHSVAVDEVYRGVTVWEGEVEVFNLTGHPRARRCYCWSRGTPERFYAILRLGLIDSPRAAVKAVVAHENSQANEAGNK